MIENDQVKYCTDANATKIIIPNGVTEISKNAFSECKALVSVTLPEGVEKIASGAFKDCSNLESINFPSTLTSVAEDAFAGCNFPQDFKASGGKFKIENSLFIEDNIVKAVLKKDLEKITVPDGVTEIKDRLFQEYGTLQSIELPSSVEKIGEETFEKCGFKEDFAVSVGNISIKNGLIIVGGEVKALANEKIKNLVIPDGVTDIKPSWSSVFVNNEYIESVVIPEGVEEIKSGTFRDCSSLSSVKFPSTITKIDGSAFENCAFPEDFVLDIGGVHFESCMCVKDGTIECLTNKNLKKVSFPEGIKEIGNNMFKNFATIENLAIPDSIEKIGGGAFENCTALKSIVIGSGVKEIGNSVFKGCSALESVKLGSGIEKIGDGCFEGTAVKEIALPEGLKQIGKNAFYNCKSLSKINIPESVEKIAEGVFKSCGFDLDFKTGNSKFRMENGFYIENGTALYAIVKNIENAVIPEGVEKIAASLFANNAALKTVAIPEGVKTIGYNAFGGCVALEEVAIPKSVTKIQAAAFDGCAALKTAKILSGKTEIEAKTFPETCKVEQAKCEVSEGTHKTTDDENYSGLTEEGFEMWTVAWDEFFDFIAEHNGEKIDVTINEADIEKFKAYFAEEAEGDSRCQDFFATIESLGIEEKSLVLRLPNGLNHFGSNGYGNYETSFPPSLAKIYLPPTFWARWNEMEDNKDLFVVPSNYTYVTREEKSGCDETHQSCTKKHYSNEPGEKENRYKTYKTNATHFPAGKYSICLSGEKGNYEIVVYDGIDDASEIARMMVDYDGGEYYNGVYGHEAKLYIKNYTTDQMWVLDGENADGDSTASLWIDGVMPCFTLDLNYFDAESYYVNSTRYISFYVGGYIDKDSDDEQHSVEFAEGINFGDIKITAISSEHMMHVRLDYVGDNSADVSDYDYNSEHEYIHILGESYDWDEVEEMAGGGYDEYGDEDWGDDD